jgi:rhodanese-related sulfurtransferase
MGEEMKLVLTALLFLASQAGAVEPSLSSSSDLAPGQVRSPLPVQDAAAAQPVAARPTRHVKGVNADPDYKAEPQFSAWPHISLEEAKRLHKDKKVLFVDARAKVEWDQAHIPGAIPLPAGEFEKYYGQYKSRLKKAKVIVSYCHGAGCHLSDKDCAQLEGKGFKNMVGFFGGWPKWQEARLPEEDKDGKKVGPPAAPAAH